MLMAMMSPFYGPMLSNADFGHRRPCEAPARGINR